MGRLNQGIRKKLTAEITAATAKKESKNEVEVAAPVKKTKKQLKYEKEIEKFLDRQCKKFFGGQVQKEEKGLMKKKTTLI